MELSKMKKGCPYGKELSEELNSNVEARLAALEAKFAAVLAATGTDDNGKTLQIDSNGKVALVTV